MNKPKSNRLPIMLGALTLVLGSQAFAQKDARKYIETRTIKSRISTLEFEGDAPLAADFGEGRRLLRHTLYHATFLPLRTSLSLPLLRSA